MSEKFKEVSFSSLQRVISEMNRLDEEGYDADPMIFNPTNGLYSVLMRHREEEEKPLPPSFNPPNWHMHEAQEKFMETSTFQTRTKDLKREEAARMQQEYIKKIYSTKPDPLVFKRQELFKTKTETPFRLNNTDRNRLALKWERKEHFFVPLYSRSELGALNLWMEYKKISTEYDNSFEPIPYECEGQNIIGIAFSNSGPTYRAFFVLDTTIVMALESLTLKGVREDLDLQFRTSVGQSIKPPTELFGDITDGV